MKTEKLVKGYFINITLIRSTGKSYNPHTARYVIELNVNNARERHSHLTLVSGKKCDLDSLISDKTSLSSTAQLCSAIIRVLFP